MMLILSRKIGEKILIDGGIEIIVTDIRGDRVRLGLTAPAGVKITRPDAIDKSDRRDQG